MNSVKAIVFDIGRVLIEWDLRLLFAKLIDDPAELDWFLANVVTPEWHFRHDAGVPLDIMVPERQREFPEHAALIEAYRQRFLETIPGPVPGTAALVERLKACGHELFALTNFGSEFWRQFRPTAPVLDHFLDIVVSGDEQLAKPDPEIYALAERRFGFVGQDVLFIDDNDANIASAREYGWQVHHFRDAATLEADLDARGLLGA